MYAQLYEFEDMGHECYRIAKLEDDQDIIPEDILSRYKNSARNEDNIWEDEYGENLMYETALIVVKQLPGTSSGGHCITTEWEQESPYSFLLSNNNPLGCSTVALGQIMKSEKRNNAQSAGSCESALWLIYSAD